MNKTDPQSVRTPMLAHPLAPRNDPNQASSVRVVRPARIERATLGLGVPCSIQFELRARTRFSLFYNSFRRFNLVTKLPRTARGCHSVAMRHRVGFPTVNSDRPQGAPARPRSSPIPATARSWAPATTCPYTFKQLAADGAAWPEEQAAEAEGLGLPLSAAAARRRGPRFAGPPIVMPSLARPRNARRLRASHL
jgi:hypothetical protein